MMTLMMMMMQMMMMVAFIHTWDRAGEGDGGGDDDDIVTQTPRKICRRAVLLCIYSTFVMSDHLI